MLHERIKTMMIQKNVVYHEVHLTVLLLHYENAVFDLFNEAYSFSRVRTLFSCAFPSPV